MGVGRQRHGPAALPPEKTRYPLYTRMGGLQGRSGRVRKISPPTGIRSQDRPARSDSLQDDQELQHGTRFAGIMYPGRRWKKLAVQFH